MQIDFTPSSKIDFTPKARCFYSQDVDKWCATGSYNNVEITMTADSEQEAMSKLKEWSDYDSVLTKKNDTPASDTEFDKAKTVSWLKSQGYVVSPASADKFKDLVLGNNSSWGGFANQLKNQRSVEPTGPVRRSAKTRKHDVEQIIFEQDRKPISETPAWVAIRDNRLAIDQASIGTAAIKSYLDGWVSGLGGAPGNIMNASGGVMMLLGDVANSQRLKNEGRAWVNASQKFRMTGERRRAWDDLINNDNLYKDTIFYQVVSGFGRIGAYAQMGSAAPLAIWSDIHNGIHDKIVEYTDEETASKNAWMLSLSLGLVSNQSINKILKSTPLSAAKTPKAFIGQVMRRVANKVPPSLFEASTEVMEELGPDMQFGGSEAVMNNLGQYGQAFVVSTIVTSLAGVGADISVDTSQSEVYKLYKNHLEIKGFQERSADRIAKEIAEGVTDTEVEGLERESKIDQIVTEEVQKEANSQALVTALNDYKTQLEAASKGVDTEEAIEGLDGKPLTSVDLEVLKNQPELLEDLDDSEEADLLKKAVEEGDSSALAEYNQRLVGVEEETALETPAPTKPSETETAIEPVQERPQEEILSDLQEQMASDKTAPQDLEQYQIETKPERNGVPRVVGLSRKANDSFNEIMGMMKVSMASRVGWTETLRNAFNLGLHKKTGDIIAKVGRGEQISSDEVAGLLIRKSEIANKIEYVENEIRRAEDAGDIARVTELKGEYDSLLDETMQVSETARLGATENARAVAAMAMWMDRKSFTLENVLAQYRKVAGQDADPQTKQEFKELTDEIKSIDDELNVAEKPKATKRQKTELQKKMDAMRRDRDRLDREQLEAQEIIKEVQNAYRRIKEKKDKGEDVNADLKLIRSRQDKLFNMIDEINRGKPAKEKIKKVRQPDSEGYLDMIETLEPELKEKRTIRKLDEDIRQMEEALKSGDLSAYMKPRDFKEESSEILEKRARKQALQKEINRRLRDAQPNTAGNYLWQAYDLFREAKLTLDIGHLFRQGGFMMSDPKMWKEGHIKTFVAESFKAFSEQRADNADLMVMSMPSYQLGQEAGLRIIQEGEQLDAREEILLNSLISKVPVIGKGQKAFARTQITGINVLRQLAFESIVSSYDGDITLEEAKDVAFAVNILTGFGEYKAGTGMLDRAMNKIMISPRFRMSRIQAPILLGLSRDGRRIWDNKVLRKRIATDTGMFFGLRILLGAMAGWAGKELFEDDVKFITNTNSWAFGRIAVKTESGQWRVYNPWAGITSLYSIMAKTAKTKDPLEAMLSSVESGAHPFLSMLAQSWQGRTYTGDKVPWYEPIARSVVPISAEGAIESHLEETGKLDLIASTVADVVGVDSSLVDKEDLFKKERPKRKKRVKYEGWFK